MSRFVDEYQERIDSLVRMSRKEFKTFSWMFLNYLKTSLPEGYEVSQHQAGKVNVSGIISHDGKHLYYNFFWNRFESTDPEDRSKGQVILRPSDGTKTAKEPMWICPISSMPKKVTELI